MRLRVLGSADAFHSAGRGHSCYLLERAAAGAARDERGGHVMVDAGATALAALAREGIDPREIHTLLLTHLHGDHAVGFPFLLIDALFNRPRKSPLRVVGPPGTGEGLEALVAATYGADMLTRERDFELTIEEIAPGESRALGEGLTLRAFAAEHMSEPAVALCLRLELDAGPTIAFTGDSALSEGIREAARGAALLVGECTAMEQPAGRHTTWSEWREELAFLDCPRVLLVHLGAEVRAAASRIARETPAGVEVILADDGMLLEV